jgi:hypothetical protein
MTNRLGSGSPVWDVFCGGLGAVIKAYQGW